jgi:hypothetical protein
MKCPARVPGQPGAPFGMLVGGLIVAYGVHQLSGGHDGLDPVEEPMNSWSDGGPCTGHSPCRRGH